MEANQISDENIKTSVQFLTLNVLTLSFSYDDIVSEF